MFSAHLFVDDAFKKGKHYKKNDNDLDINEYVQTLIDVLDEAAQNVHQRYMKIKPPEIYLTPYGGRIEWTLPGHTKLIAHLKDKTRIRHRKRWSQASIDSIFLKSNDFINFVSGYVHVLFTWIQNLSGTTRSKRCIDEKHIFTGIGW